MKRPSPGGHRLLLQSAKLVVSQGVVEGSCSAPCYPTLIMKLKLKLCLHCFNILYRTLVKSLTQKHQSLRLQHYSWVRVFIVIAVISCLPPHLSSSSSPSYNHTTLFSRYSKYPYLSFLLSTNEYQNCDATFVQS